MRETSIGDEKTEFLNLIDLLLRLLNPDGGSCQKGRACIQMES